MAEFSSSVAWYFEVGLNRSNCWPIDVLMSATPLSSDTDWFKANLLFLLTRALSIFVKIVSRMTFTFIYFLMKLTMSNSFSTLLRALYSRLPILPAKSEMKLYCLCRFLIFRLIFYWFWSFGELASFFKFLKTYLTTWRSKKDEESRDTRAMNQDPIVRRIDKNPPTSPRKSSML